MSRTQTQKGLLVAVCLALVAGIWTSRVDGYQITGMKWRTSQVLYYVNTQNRLLSSSEVLTALSKGAALWTDQTRANVQLVYAGATSGSSFSLNYKNEVFFRNVASSYGGETYWYADASGYIVDSDTVFYDSSTNFSSGSGCGSGLYLEDLAAHEFGHTLGLYHSSVNTATMSTTYAGPCTLEWMTLDPDDIAGIEALYPPTSTSQVPAAPSNLAVAASSANPTASLVLSWSDNSNNESGFRVERSTDGWSFALVAQLGSNVRSFTDSGLGAGTWYAYRVAASNSGGTSAFSNVGTAQTQVPTVSNTAPLVTIANPLSNASFPLGVTTSFAGVANDSSDGELSSQLVWTSNIDGAIGHGAAFSRALSAGVHTVRAAVADSGGLVGANQVMMTITVTSGPVLTARGYKTKGVQKVDLTWSGFSATSVDLYRNNEKVLTTPNDGAHTETLKKGGGSYQYQACAAGTTTCSNAVNVAF